MVLPWAVLVDGCISSTSLSTFSLAGEVYGVVLFALAGCLEACFASSKTSST